MHHCQWKCTVNYDETVLLEYPFPYKATRPRVEVVVIDKDHLHRCPGDTPAERLLKESEYLRQTHDEWRRFWMDDQPANPKPHRTHGGIGPDPENPYKNILKTVRETPQVKAKGVNFAPNMARLSGDVQSIVGANNQFAFDLYNRLSREDGNLFFSPYSISKALAMVYAGARGDTEREMANVLHFTLGQDRQHKAFSETRKLLNGGKGAFALPNPFRKDVQLYLSVNLWGQRGYGFQKDYLNLIRNYYGGELQEVDFAAAEPARRQINAWVQQQTRNKIKDLFADGTISSDTRLVLATAIYFKGDWAKRFKKLTRNDDFWISADKAVKVPLMNQTDTFGYFGEKDYQALQLPYQGKNLAMVVLLPNARDGLAKLEKSLTAKMLADCMNGFREQQVHVWLPRFKMDTAYDLNRTLSDLGMDKAFGAGADFGGMNGGQHKLVINKVAHKAFVEVNEQGTEAAAATGVEMELTAPRVAPPSPPVIRADHPFLFAIVDQSTGLILFLGRVTKP